MYSNLSRLIEGRADEQARVEISGWTGGDR